jgi:hypothetical protein
MVDKFCTFLKTKNEIFRGRYPHKCLFKGGTKVAGKDSACMASKYCHLTFSYYYTRSLARTCPLSGLDAGLTIKIKEAYE